MELFNINKNKIQQQQQLLSLFKVQRISEASSMSFRRENFDTLFTKHFKQFSSLSSNNALR